MKLFLVTLFVALVSSVPVDESGNPVEVIVNGLAEGEPLEIGGTLEVKVKESLDGQVVASNDALHQFTAEGIAAAAAADNKPEDNVQIVEDAENIVLPQLPEVPEVAPIEVLPIAPPEVIVVPDNVLPEPVAVPDNVLPEPIAVPDNILPEPIAVPDNILPEPIVILPEIISVGDSEQPDVVGSLPEPVGEFPNGEVFNNGAVQVTVNANEEGGVLTSIQSWFSMVVNYFNGPEQTSQQIV